MSEEIPKDTLQNNMTNYQKNLAHDYRTEQNQWSLQDKLYKFLQYDKKVLR